MPDIEIPTLHHINRSHFSHPKPTLRNILKDATVADHRRLDARLGALPLDTADGYRRFLEINAAALLPLESALGDAGVRHLLPDWDLRIRTDAIMDDLAALGGASRHLGVDALPDRAAMLGTLYVLEGSRLGAAYLLKSLARSNDPLVSGNTRYLGHGAGRRFWTSFLDVLENHVETTDANDVTRSARRTFDLFAESARGLS